MLSIQLLGTPLLTLDGEPLSLSRRKSRALLFYLAANTAPLTRDQILALFWPDYDRTSAQQILRTSLHGLRKALGRRYRFPTTHSRSRPTSRWIHATSRPRLPVRRATHRRWRPRWRFRGDFLDGFSLPDAEEFESWLTVARERYRQLAVRGCVALAQQWWPGTSTPPRSTRSNARWR